MFQPITALPAHTRVWIYQADRVLQPDEVSKARERLQRFCEGWAAHGAPVHGHADVWHGLFLIFLADEKRTGVSGCSIDSSVAEVRALGERFGVDFFQRLNLACRTSSGIQLLHRDELPDAIKNGTIGPDTPVFDNLVQNKADWESSWEKPLSQTWAAGFLPTTAGR